MDNIFISYKVEKEHDFLLSKIVEKLKNDFFKVWIEKEKFMSGDRDLENGILEADFVFCFISNQYVQSKSCRQELISSNEKNKNCIYIMLEKVEKSFTNGINIYLYSESNRIDAYKLKNESRDDHADLVYTKLSTLMSKTNKIMNSLEIDSKRDDYFTGRNDVLKQIDLYLSEKKNICICGDDGIGKTSCVIEYIYRQLELKFLKKIYWFSANSEVKILASIYKYASKIDKNEKNIKSLAQILLNSINEIYNEAILVFDEVEKLADITDIINLKHVKAPIIITSRHVTMEKHFTMINITSYVSNQANVHLKALMPLLSANDIEKILKDSTELYPYKINEIAGILKNDSSITINEFCKLNSTNGQIEFTIKKIDNDSIKLLQYLMFLDSDYIPLDLLKLLKTQNHVKQSLQKLENFNLISIINPNSPRFGIKIHKLTRNNFEQFFENNKMHAIKDEIKVDIIRALDQLFPLINNNPSSEWDQATAYVSHVLFFLNKIDLDQYKLIASKLLDKVGSYHFNIEQNYEASLNSAEKSLKLRQKLYQGENTEIAQSFLDIGISYECLGNDKKALHHKVQSLKMRKKLFTGDHPDIAKTFKSIG
jgi:hypothetical protein